MAESDMFDRLIEGAPKPVRPVIQYAAFLTVLAVGVLGIEHGADAHIIKKIKPLRIRVATAEAIVEHILEDHEEERAAQGLTHHSPSKIREDALNRAREEQKQDEENGE